MEEAAAQALVHHGTMSPLVLRSADCSSRSCSGACWDAGPGTPCNDDCSSMSSPGVVLQWSGALQPWSGGWGRSPGTPWSHGAPAATVPGVLLPCSRGGGSCSRAHMQAAAAAELGWAKIDFLVRWLRRRPWRTMEW